MSKARVVLVMRHREEYEGEHTHGGKRCPCRPVAMYADRSGRAGMAAVEKHQPDYAQFVGNAVEILSRPPEPSHKARPRKPKEKPAQALSGAQRDLFGRRRR
jgi:hypothetical protein